MGEMPGDQNQLEERISTSECKERAVSAKDERCRCIAEFPRELSHLQQFTKDFNAKPDEVSAQWDIHEQAFHEVVSSHEKYMELEKDMERVNYK